MAHVLLLSNSDESWQRTLARQIQKSGHTLISSYWDGQKIPADAMLEIEKVDVLVCDINHGHPDTMREILAAAGNKPVMFISAYPEIIAKEEDIAQKAAQIIGKVGYEKETLLAFLDRSGPDATPAL